jgi:hypothetical protein
MGKLLARAALGLVVALVAGPAAAQTTSDSTHHDAGSGAPVIGTPVSDAVVAMPSPMPIDVRGYQLTDSVHLGDVSSGVDYTYTRHKSDVIHAFISPYQSGSKLQTRDDTATMVQGDVDMLRQSLDDAARHGELSAFRTLSERTDGLHTAGRGVQGYALIAGITHRGGTTAPAFTTPPCSGRLMVNPRTSGACQQIAEIPGFQAYTYYAVYALPQWVVRVRAELPRQNAASEEAPDFAHKLVAALLGSH